MTPYNKLLRCASDVLDLFTLPRQFKAARVGLEPTFSFYLLSFGRRGETRTQPTSVLSGLRANHLCYSPICNDSRLSAAYLFLIFIVLFRAFARLVATIFHRNFKWVGVPLSHFSTLSTRRLTVLLFICVQTGSIQRFYVLEGDVDLETTHDLTRYY